MREIVLDTETTGLSARDGDRLIEIGCIELINRFPTGREFHRFLHPETRDVHPDAQAIHGISMQMLVGKPFFRSEVDAFLDFIGGDTLVIHNAPFDIGFINSELERLKRPPLVMDRVVDTLALARRKHPGAPATLDALCRRYNIDTSQRTKHGAIVDSLLLAQVYVELLGVKQAALELSATSGAEAGRADGPRSSGGAATRAASPARRPTSLPPRLSPADRAAHDAFVETLGPNALWKRFAKT